MKKKCAAFFLALFACQLPSAALAFQSYFESPSFQADTIAQFPKWTGMLARLGAEAKPLDAICQTETLSPCHLKGWKEFLQEQKGKEESEQIRAVNAFINGYPYIEDIVNWGQTDYWETPYEFQRISGDCEDFSIAKYISLRALGLDEDRMRIAIVRDMNLGGIIHAVLLVKEGNQSYVLDNQIKQVVPASSLYHYVPVYAINTRHWWQYFTNPPS